MANTKIAAAMRNVEGKLDKIIGELKEEKGDNYGRKNHNSS
jgi:uncharacterized protein YjbJ (UPF0337 family)